ncbi:MAG: bifunctional ADP-dependent NAD(P)H-hydrate dehydratase/NAD(P)H-hydrate epimerase [Chloracidobacterium sp. CP2_5A]|nr:MAG: bifunctional ADP-dependent NAD(P)H-hydrate dehydratase/NAD(P)H-hydrate epimerase [Chloracidobacterium sp. CP2_5A]
MQPILSAAHMAEVDRLTSEQYGIPGLLLMENAAVGATLAIEERFGPVQRARVFCGKGNNGGDGAAVARQLWMRGAQVEVLLFGKRETARGDARVNFDIVAQLAQGSSRIRLLEVSNEAEFAAVLANSSYRFNLYIDALFGTGLGRGLEGMFVRVVEHINSARQYIPVCALDLPSGLAADLPHPVGVHVVADLTVTFTAPKIANVLPPAGQVNGALRVVDIGSPKSLVRATPSHRAALFRLTSEGVGAYLERARRMPDAHKGHVGHVLLIAGSRGKTGAAALAGEGVMRAGAGLLTIACPASAQALLVSQCLPEAMTLGLEDDGRGQLTADGIGAAFTAANQHTVCAVGPGLGASAATRRLAQRIVKEGKAPTVLDADALNCLSPWQSGHGTPERPIILTPHPGEMARLLGVSVNDILVDRLGAARRLATAYHLFVVLKGYYSLVATPEGDIYVNPTGNAGMATGGSGDALTGILAGLLAQTPHLPLEATLAAVYLHGQAGDLANAALGERALVASDILRYLPQAFKACAPAD